MPGYSDGPWRKAGNIIWGAEIAKQICLVRRLSREPGESTAFEESANARLISAAPELYEALQVAYIQIQSDLNSRIHQEVEANCKQIILNVIQKALDAAVADE